VGVIGKVSGTGEDSLGIVGVAVPLIISSRLDDRVDGARMADERLGEALVSNSLISDADWTRGKVGDVGSAPVKKQNLFM
jgi:hypothetical protein